MIEQKMIKKTMRIGRVVFEKEYPAVVHQKHGAVFAVNVERAFELDAAAFLVTRPKPLTGEHMRFLRRVMGLRSDELATLLDVSRMSVSRYEGGAKLPATVDHALRWVVSSRLAAEQHSPNLAPVARPEIRFGASSPAAMLLQEEPSV